MIIKEVKKLREKVTEDWSFENPKKDTKEFAKELIDAMWSYSGLGISANQIGYSVRAFAMRGETKKDSIVCFNPEIKTFSDNMNTMEEGCLSLPDVYGKVVRPAEVAISYLDEDGKEEKNKRKPIPKSVQREVWRRDQAKCQECGSKENLEYDHIIPVSKGRANTVRNIQLLCEKHNRSKGANIG